MTKNQLGPLQGLLILKPNLLATYSAVTIITSFCYQFGWLLTNYHSDLLEFVFKRLYCTCSTKHVTYSCIYTSDYNV